MTSSGVPTVSRTVVHASSACPPAQLLFFYLQITRLQATGFMPTDHSPLGLVDEDFALGNYANPGFCDLRNENLFPIEVPGAS